MTTDRTQAPATGPSPLVSLAYLFVFLAVVFLAAAAGGAITSTSVGTWYQDLAKPALTPARWVFPVAWNFLYFLMAISAWLVWRAAGSFDRAGFALSLFGIQLSLNLSWSIVFFGLMSPSLGIAAIIALDLAIIGTMLAFFGISRLAALLLVPYLGWTLFATYLTIAIAVLNA
ncbi:TspO and MBR like protein [Parvibaculum lavamentivorans DS-1]|uniref:TspO and MBR like protein n=1 Tax=Parvibaculum lavamentivorans (strain DS-1 / DSM 13023 / NCIMB 13966) TaxID=402881 RepID=A7HQR8_PARL1|nr:TspO/MBR family protein [Parvibaculum lavamentivorans]ABS62251.1 TspO and MBR like protein [Parvibaculum lavamentivorans DS-1]